MPQKRTRLARKNACRAILLCGKNPLSYTSGYTRYALSLAQAIARTGVPVDIVSCGPKSDRTPLPYGTLYTVGSLMVSLPFFRGREMAALPFLALSMARFAQTLIDKYSGTVILWGIGPWSLAGVAHWRSPSHRRVICVSNYFTTVRHELSAGRRAIEAHPYGWKEKVLYIVIARIIEPIFSRIEKTILMKSDIIVSHYQSTENILSNQFTIPRHRFVRIPYSIADYPIRPSKGASRRSLQKHDTSFPKPLIVTIARHDPRKGIPYLFQALASLSRDGVPHHALIIGSGPLLSSHKTMAKTMGLSTVSFLQKIPDIRLMLKNSSVLVLPSLEEGSSSLALLEAARAGLPIVATAIDGIIEDFRHNVSALLVPPEDPTSLAAAITTVLTNRATAKRLSRGALRAYRENHSANDMYRAIRTFLSGLRT